jgi:hypothetical protein
MSVAGSVITSFFVCVCSMLCIITRVFVSVPVAGYVVTSVFVSVVGSVVTRVFVSAAGSW